MTWRLELAESWGGKWTDKKLEVLSKYFQAFQRALKDKGFSTWYVDALAGDGKGNPRAALPLFFDDEDFAAAEDLRSGSAAYALSISPQFQAYRLNEQNPSKADSLRALVSSSGIAENRVIISSDDANDFVLKVLGEINLSKDRGIVLLDPFGMQISWSTIVAIAQKGERNRAWLDLWYLFPTMAVVRMLTRKGLPTQTWQNRLDDVLGTHDWSTEFYMENSKPDLFSQTVNATDRMASFDSVEAFIVRRLKSTFRGTVIEEPLRLGPTSKPIFSLCFASGNPSDAAKKLTRKLAADILGANQPRLI